MKKITCSHDTDVPVEEWPVRPYSKSELARAYAPEIGERSALNRLSRWLHGRASVSGFAGYGLPFCSTDFYQQTGGTDF